MKEMTLEETVTELRRGLDRDPVAVLAHGLSLLVRTRRHHPEDLPTVLAVFAEVAQCASGSPPPDDKDTARLDRLMDLVHWKRVGDELHYSFTTPVPKGCPIDVRSALDLAIMTEDSSTSKHRC